MATIKTHTKMKKTNKTRVVQQQQQQNEPKE
jgi:hypothetical protein